jgi:hypothetical protein
MYINSKSIVRVDAEVDRVPGRRSDAGSVVRPDGLSARMVALSGFGNAIVPQVAAEFIGAYLDVTSDVSGPERSA